MDALPLNRLLTTSYWGYEHPYATHMVSIREGGIIPQLPQDSGRGVIDEFLSNDSISQETESEPEEISKDASKKPVKQNAIKEYELVVKDPFIGPKVSNGSFSQTTHLFRSYQRMSPAPFQAGVWTSSDIIASEWR
jgi:hypothetical protein